MSTLKIFNTALFVIVAGFFTTTIAQTESYNDVAVVINTASSISDSVGTYFVNVHHIPTENIIQVVAPTTEEIDSVRFENLRQQIESILISRNLKDSINYIVTTKGVPLKVVRQGAFASSSVESDLTLILGPYASFIGGSGNIAMPYYKKHEDFTHAKYGFYFVTRLDGYTFQDIKGLIDRASVIPNSIPSQAQVVLDMDPEWTAVQVLNDNMKLAADSLAYRGITSFLDTTATFVTDKINVLGYTSFGSNDHHCQLFATNAKPKNTYLPGAIAETYVSTSARSFTAPPVYGQSLIADLIAEGITAAKGYVYEPYSDAMTDVSVLFSMYADGFTVAESFYASSPYLSWMDVIIGDPKFRLVPTRMPADSGNLHSGDTIPLPVELTSLTTFVSKNSVNIHWTTATERECYGFNVERRIASHPSFNDNQWITVGFVSGHGSSSTQNAYQYNDENILPGKYIYRLKQIDDNGSFTFFGNSEIEITQPVKQFCLYNNYPNPFNPSTTIKFTVAQDGIATVCIYNILGQTVQTIFREAATAGVEYQTVFDASTLPSGIYFARLTSGNQSVVKKMLLTK